MKKLIYSVLSFLLLSAFLCGCQQTPASDSVFNKGNDTLDEDIKRTAAPNATDIDEIESEWVHSKTFGNNCVLNINAQIIMPEKNV